MNKFKVMVLFIFFLFCLYIPSNMNNVLLADDNKNKILKLRDEAELLFNQGIETKNHESANAFFSAAKDKYNEISEIQKFSNGYIFYNIANCYFMMKQYGVALLYYRKAEKLIPNDKNLKSNIIVTIKKLDDTIAKPQINKVLEIIFFWHYSYSLSSRIIIFISSVSLFFFILTLQIFKPLHFFNWIKTIFLIVSICVAGSIAYQYYLDNHDIRGVITADSVTARKGNSESYEPSFNQPLNEGVEFRLIQTKGEWYNIKLDNGAECWIEKNSAGII